MGAESLEHRRAWPLGDGQDAGDRARDQSHAGDRCEVDEPYAVTPDANLTSGFHQCQPRLTHAAGARQRDETLLAQQALEFPELSLSPDEAAHLRGQVVPLLEWRSLGDLVTQDVPLERLELLARLQTELLTEEPARAAVGGQRISLALAAEEGEHELAPEALAKWLLRDQALQLRGKLGMPAKGEFSIDPLFQTGKAKLVQALGFQRKHAAIGHIGQCRPAPQPKRGPQAVGGKAGGAAGKRITAFAQEPIETPGVQPLRRHLKNVPRRARGYDVLPQRGPQARHVCAQRPLGTGGRVPVPELLNQPVAQHRPAGAEQEQDKQGALTTTSELQQLARPSGFHRAQDPELAAHPDLVRHDPSPTQSSPTLRRLSSRMSRRFHVHSNRSRRRARSACAMRPGPLVPRPQQQADAAPSTLTRRAGPNLDCTAAGPRSRQRCSAIHINEAGAPSGRTPPAMVQRRARSMQRGDLIPRQAAPWASCSRGLASSDPAPAMASQFSGITGSRLPPQANRTTRSRP